MNLSNLDERKKRIISIVYHSKSPIQMQNIASRLGVSSRTVATDIKDINYQFKSLGMEIVSKPRIGNWMEIRDDKKENFIMELSNIFKASNDEECSRVNYIIKKILMADGYISMQEIADELYVSKATVNINMKNVEEVLSKNKLTFIKKTKYGMKVSGEEKNIRALLTKILKDDNDVSILLSNNCNGEIQMDLILSDFIDDNFNKALINYLTRFVNSLSKDMKLRLSYERLNELVCQLLVTYYRLKQNHLMQFSTEKILEIIAFSEFKIVKSLLEDIEKDVSIRVPMEEIAYITLFCIEDKVNIEEFNKQEKDIYLNNDHELTLIINEICNFVKETYNLKLKDDKQLMKGLRLHLASAINRLKFGIDLSNPLIEEIKKNYPYAFQIAVDIGNHINEQFGVEMTENEIGYVTLHIEAFIEKNAMEKHKTFKAFVVCGTGIGVAQLLSVQIKKQFRNIDVTKLVSGLWICREINSINEKEIPDIIITSIPLPKLKVPVVQVSPIMTTEDISKIQYQVDCLIKERNKNKNNNYPMLRKYLNVKSSLIDISIDNSLDIITLLSKGLEAEGCITKHFAKSAISREELSCTYLSNGVAIPHGYVQEVKEPAITFAKLKEPVNWGGNKVELVFLCALNSKIGNDVECLFTELFEIVNNKDLLKKLKKIDSKENLFKYLGWE